MEPLKTDSGASSIRGWCNAILPQAKALSTDTARIYGNEDRVQHYFDTAEVLEKMVPDDRTLAQAGFLHGVRDLSLLSQVRDAVDPGALSILEDRNRLRMIDKPDADVPTHLTANVLPNLRHARSALLLVVEQLLHVDPHRELFAFSREFPRTPGVAPSEIHICPGDFPDVWSHLDYLRLVIIPTSHFFGLWFEKNLCEDLCLYHANRDRFSELLEFVHLKVKSGAPERRAAIISDALQRHHDVEVFWEWHHLASLDHRLTTSATQDIISQPLSSCGMVTVICPTREQCYEAVSSLHLNPAFQHQTLDIRDTLGSPQISGYEAFHTVLVPISGDEKSIKVRIIFRESHQKRFELFSEDRLNAMQKQLEAHRSGELQVFANDGRAFPLPKGSVVLNFAYEVHNDFVALAQRAYVNGNLVDLLHPLQERDVVRLEVGPEPHLLPVGWEEKVPKETVAKIRRRHNACYKPNLVKAGRRLLRSRLRKHGIEGIEREDIYDDRTVDSILEQALVNVAPIPGQSFHIASASWWFRQMAQPEQDQLYPALKKSVSQMAEQLVADVAHELVKNPRIGIESFSFPRDMEGNFDRLVLCDVCKPLPGQTVVGTVVKKSLLVHLQGCRSAENCRPIEWMQRFTRGQYFVVEMINRLGMAVELLSVIAARNVDIIDIATATLGPSWAVMRIHVQPIGPDLINEVARSLSRVQGVIRILGPEDETIPVLEGPLPPRQYARYSLFAQQSPYFHGPWISEDLYFYGRERELARLRTLFQQVRSVQRSGGSNVFVKGPKKTGKTSLVQRFLRELQRSEYSCVTVSLTAEPDEGWQQLEARLQLLCVERRNFITRDNPDYASGGTVDLPSLLSSFHNELNRSLVLIIDEATSMFFHTVRSHDEGRLVSFMRMIEKTPGVLLIWVGPDIPVAAFPLPFLEALRAAHEVKVPGLDQLEVKNLLKAENWKYRGLCVEVEDAVLQETFRFTRGNAYWCNVLADELFSMQQIRNGRTCFHTAQLKLAKDKLIENQIAFCDRVEDFLVGSVLQGAVPLVLRTLAETGKAISTDELVEVVRAAGFEIDKTKMNHVLDQLRTKGSVELAEGQALSWRIGPPALAEHISRCLAA